MTYRVRIDRIRRLADNSVAIEYTEARDTQLGAERSKRGIVVPQMTRGQVARAMEASFGPEQMLLLILADWLGTADPLSSLAGKVATIDATAATTATGLTALV